MLALEQPDLRPKTFRSFQDTGHLMRRAAAQAMSPTVEVGMNTSQIRCQILPVIHARQ